MIGVAGPSPYMWYHSWGGDPTCFDKAGGVSPGEQAGKQHSSMASTPVSASRFLSWLPSVLSGEINPFFPMLLLVMVFNIKVTET